MPQSIIENRNKRALIGLNALIVCALLSLASCTSSAPPTPNPTRTPVVTRTPSIGSSILHCQETDVIAEDPSKNIYIFPGGKRDYYVIVYKIKKIGEIARVAILPSGKYKINISDEVSYIEYCDNYEDAVRLRNSIIPFQPKSK